ncbi:MAG: hypothetical protein KDE22_01905 [Rhodobacterales bacterium]|nr:hypothetical protein [Rhodobacterales bacterium]
MKTTLALAAVLAATLMSGPAQAVDVKNADDESHVVLVEDSNGERQVTIAGGETAAPICDVCVLTLGDDVVDAEGQQTVMIKGGRLTISE